MGRVDWQGPEHGSSLGEVVGDGEGSAVGAWWSVEAGISELSAHGGNTKGEESCT